MTILVPIVTTNPVPVVYDISEQSLCAFVDGKSFRAHVGTIHEFEHDRRRCVSADEMLRVGRAS